MLKGVRKALRKAGHVTWIQLQESGAIMTGTPVRLDPRVTGDNYQPSPLVREDIIREDYEITETREVHERRSAK